MELHDPAAMDTESVAPEASRQLLEVASTLTRMSRVVAARRSRGRWVVIDAVDHAADVPGPGDALDARSLLCAAALANGTVLQCADTRVPFEAAPAIDGVGSWIAVPLLGRDGAVLGVLCATDAESREIGPQRVGILCRLATVYTAAIESIDARVSTSTELAETQLQLARSRHDLDVSSQHLMDAEGVARLREEFIAVLAHDLRNPLQSIRMAAEILGEGELPARQQRLVGHLHESVARMSELIEVTMDFARGRLGGGLSLELSPCTALQTQLQRVVDEVRQGYPDRTIHASLEVPASMHCDEHRLGQLLSNLLVNAAVHGREDSPIQVIAASDGQRFELSVANRGYIAPAQAARIFEPFDRPGQRRNEPGLGLGLYIANQIAIAHGGTLDVFSTADAGTIFEFSMPVAMA